MSSRAADSCRCGTAYSITSKIFGLDDYDFFKID